MSKMADKSVHLIFADPPYWMRVDGKLHRVEGTQYAGCDDKWDNQFADLADYESFTESWLAECKRILHPNGSIWVIGGMQCIYTIGAIMQRLGFWIINDVIWNKTNPTPNFMGTRVANSHETLIWASLGERSRYTFNYHTAKFLNRDTVSEEDHKSGVRKQLGSVWRIPICKGKERIHVNGKRLHSTQKPEELLTRIIAISSKVGDIVMDPFGGTMTTAAVAKRLGRRYIAIDSNATYCEYGKRRVDAVVEELSDVAKATFDIKPVPVNMQKLLECGLLHGEEPLYLVSDESQSGILTSSGQVQLNDELVMDIHKAAAHCMPTRAPRLNGFHHWYVLRNGQQVTLDELRTQYRAEHSAAED